MSLRTFSDLQEDDIESKLSNRLTLLLTKQKYTDCTFKIDDEFIQCHKILLASASPVFEAMFYGSLANNHQTSNDNQIKYPGDNARGSTFIEIIDITPDVFNIMIKFIYTDEIDLKMISIDNLLELYYCGEKYLIQHLRSKCIHAMDFILDKTNIFLAFDLVILSDLTVFAGPCIDYFIEFIRNSKNYVNDILKYYHHLSRKCLKYLINGITETDLQMNVMFLIKVWYRKECELLLPPEQPNGDDDDYDDVTGRTLEEIHKFLINDIQLSIDKWSTIQTTNFGLCRKATVTTDGTAANGGGGGAGGAGGIFRTHINVRELCKAMKPFNLSSNRLTFQTSVKTNYNIRLRTLFIHSRIGPYNIQYTENLSVKIYTADNENYHCEKFIVFNQDYNSIVSLKFEHPIAIAADRLFLIDIVWNKNAIGHQYYMVLQSTKAETNYGEIKFDTHLLYLQNSILHDMEYDIVV